MIADSWLDIAGLVATLVAGILFGALVVDALVAEPVRRSMWHWRLQSLTYARRAARAESVLALTRRQDKLIRDILTTGEPREPQAPSAEDRAELKAATDFYAAKTFERRMTLLPPDPRD